MKSIPMVDIRVPESAKRHIAHLLNEANLSAGEEVSRFEKKFAAYCGTDHGVACVNGTQALHAVWMSLGVTPGQHIITTPFTFIASSNSILQAQAIPIFADIDPRTYNLDPNQVEDIVKRQPNTKYALLVHLYGLPVDIPAFLFLREKYGLTIVEDCAQAHGATFDDKKVGTFFDAAAFSFYATKNVYCGEGGMCFFAQKEHRRLARKIINHGRSENYSHDVLGHNYRLSDLQAAIGNAVLDEIDTLNRSRQENAVLYSSSLPQEVTLPVIPERYSHVYHQYVIRTPERDALRRHLSEKSIQTGVVYPVPNHRQAVYLKLFPHLKDQMLPEVEKTCREVISLPVHPYLQKNEIESVAGKIGEFFA